MVKTFETQIRCCNTIKRKRQEKELNRTNHGMDMVDHTLSPKYRIPYCHPSKPYYVNIL